MQIYRGTDVPHSGQATLKFPVKKPLIHSQN